MSHMAFNTVTAQLSTACAEFIQKHNIRLRGHDLASHPEPCRGRPGVAPSLSVSWQTSVGENGRLTRDRDIRLKGNGIGLAGVEYKTSLVTAEMAGTGFITTRGPEVALETTDHNVTGAVVSIIKQRGKSVEMASTTWDSRPTNQSARLGMNQLKIPGMPTVTLVQCKHPSGVQFLTL
ncbi:hypothetical protein PoB_002523600 [Plakobranchus ocellatus]|uniref:Uncharacterized protein n=1 Tax=Plakobranchus ocellatus TaxID=259542 RepID=A0AAV3ZRX6_9GAST|nr:hypothetical protein PoB_002523600 [Plakobranchus ocellatus]